MSRWEYDTVFYRVFCVTLLGIAFTFTVVLTNVFVDIDGMITGKDKDDSIFHIKDPKVKKLLTSHLANLLDELDQEDYKTKHNNDRKPTTDDNNTIRNVNDKHLLSKNGTNDKEIEESKNLDKKDVLRIKKYYLNNIEKSKTNIDKVTNPQINYKAELLNLAMHNVILQGILENKDLDDVYKQVADLVKDFGDAQDNINKDDQVTLFKIVDNLKNNDRGHKEIYTEDSDEELGDTRKSGDSKAEQLSSSDVVQNSKNDPKLIIKTIIDITALTNDKSNKENYWNAKNAINGRIKVIYNGNTINFKNKEDETKPSRRSASNNLLMASTKTDQKNDKYITKNHDLDSSQTNLNENYYQKVFYDYLKQSESRSSEKGKIFSSKRLKRHIKIRFNNNNATTAKPKPKKDDDELFVEIETHFDSKGTKGEKKKKLIRDLIEKIQNAIHSDNNSSKKKQKRLHVKKRMQNSLSSKNAATLINKLIIPLETMARRHLDPISKAVGINEEVPIVSSKHGINHWQKPYDKPGFFAKNIYSAEMNTVDTDYNKVMKHNGIPQRLQKPLNTDMSDEVLQDTKIVDLGNIKFLMKDIDGSGFSIGFNQYTDEAPDAETMKLFSGLENIIQTYHQQYDQETSNTQSQYVNENLSNNAPYDTENYEQVEKSVPHLIKRRSIQNLRENEHHLNSHSILHGYKLQNNNNHDKLSYSENKHSFKHNNFKVYKTNHKKLAGFIIDENVFEKKLRPAEILSIADLFERKKRSLKVKKISKVNIKQKMNKYLNTKKMSAKSTYLNNKKRIKREVDKIRIIARDLPSHRDSEEDNIFLVSDEKIFADRSLVREVEIPEIESHDKPESIEPHYDIISPQKEIEPNEDVETQKINEDHFDSFIPYVYQTSPFESQNEFSRRARHNSLMSKYPHIIMEEPPVYMDHGEQFILEIPQPQQYNAEVTAVPTVPTMVDMPSVNESDMADFITPPKDLSNYRVSVKIRPKNATGLSGFKEVHTSINKSYNKNGLMYTSLVNVSQLSKVEKVNKTSARRDNTLEQKENLKQQQELIKTLIQKHKQRLDEQLKHLRLERLKLETMSLENVDNISDIFQKDKNIQVTSKKARKSTKENVGKKKSKPEGTTTKDSTVTQRVTIDPTTTRMTTTEYFSTIEDQSIKTKMIETIERNENITNELLKKIDLNTGILKVFLGKLISTIETSSKKAIAGLETTTGDVKSYYKPYNDQETSIDKTTVTASNIIHDFSTGMRSHHVPINYDEYQYMPNILFRNIPKAPNNTNGIPFIYALQHPYGAIPNSKNMASIVYQGHIHTNNLNGNNNVNTDNKNKNYNMINTDNKNYNTINTDNKKYDTINTDNKNQNHNVVNTEIKKYDTINTDNENKNYNMVNKDNKNYNILDVDRLKMSPVLPNNVILDKNDNVGKKVLDTEFWKPKPGEKVINDFVINKNSSKFFLDESDNHYKMAMLGNNTKLAK